MTINVRPQSGTDTTRLLLGDTKKRLEEAKRLLGIAGADPAETRTITLLIDCAIVALRDQSEGLRLVG